MYLQKIEKDTILKTIDSVAVLGSDQFTLDCRCRRARNVLS